jgi:hypothetical protein
MMIIQSISRASFGCLRREINSIQQPVKQGKGKNISNKKINNKNEQLPFASLKLGTNGRLEQLFAPIKDLFRQ